MAANIDILVKIGGIIHDKFIIVSPSASLEDFAHTFFQVLDDEGFEIQFETASWIAKASQFYAHGSQGDKLVRQGVLRHAIRKGLSIIIRDASSSIVSAKPRQVIERRQQTLSTNKRNSNNLATRGPNVEDLAAAIISQMNMHHQQQSDQLSALVAGQQDIVDVATRHATRMEASVKKITNNQDKHYKGIKKTMNTTANQLSTQMDENEKSIRSQVDRIVADDACSSVK